MARVLSTNKAPGGVEVEILLKERGFMPEVVARTRVRVRALAATGFGFGDPSETEQIAGRVTEIKSVNKSEGQGTVYTVLVDTPF